MSSTIIFVSSQKSERRNNQINDFEIDVKPEIDARSGRKQLIVEEILYPKTISSIHPRNKEQFKFKFKLNLERFVRHKTAGFKTSKFESQHDWVYIPYGHHGLKKLVRFIDKVLNKINCGVRIVMGQKCVINCNKHISVYSSAPNSFDGYENNVYMEKLTNRLNEKDQCNVKIEITFSPGLVHVLGITNDVVKFQYNYSNAVSTDILEYKGLYVMDPSYGLNFMSVTCEQINPVKMGFEFKERLLLCPVDLADDGRMTASFVPKNCNRVLRPGIIRSMHFVVEDEW